MNNIKIFWSTKLKNENELKHLMLKHSYSAINSYINVKKITNYMNNEDTRWNYGRVYQINLEGYINSYKIKDVKKVINYFVGAFTYVKKFKKKVPSFWYINEENILIIVIIERLMQGSTWSEKITYYKTKHCLQTFFINFCKKTILILKKVQINKNLSSSQMKKHAIKRDIIIFHYNNKITKFKKKEESELLEYAYKVKKQVKDLFGKGVMFINDL